MKLVNNQRFSEFEEKQSVEVSKLKDKVKALRTQNEQDYDAYLVWKSEFNHDLTKAKAEARALQDLKYDADKNAKKELDLESWARELGAQEKELDAMDKAYGALAPRLEKATDEGYKKGYADGLGDGIREATKITAEDRQMMGQIAGLAAASHSSDASKEIGEAVAESIRNNTQALNSGK